MSYSSGRFWTKRILFGGRYSSGMTAAPAGLEDLRPAPRVGLMGRAVSGTPTAALRFRALCSAASAAFFLSVYVVNHSPKVIFSKKLTLLCQSPPLMTLKFLLVPHPLDRRIASCLSKRQLHWFLKELKALNLLDCLLSTLHTLKHYKSLSLCLQVCLCNYLDNLAIFGEELGESFFQLVDFNAFFEVTNIDSTEGLVRLHTCRMCNDTYVALGGGLVVDILTLGMFYVRLGFAGRSGVEFQIMLQA